MQDLWGMLEIQANAHKKHTHFHGDVDIPYGCAEKAGMVCHLI